jgi:hypothetical protein
MANPVVDAILAKTTDRNTRLALLMGSNLESGWNPSAVGDNNTSFGPFQIHLPAHPGVTAAQAEDPGFAVDYMFGAYQAGVSRVPSSLWSSDPATAAATAAYYAERPAQMYPAPRVQAAWPGVSAAASGGGVTIGGPDSTTTVVTDPTGLLGSVTAIGSALDDFGKSFAELPKVFDLMLKLAEPSTWVRVGAAFFGVVFILISVFLLGREVIA